MGTTVCFPRLPMRETHTLPLGTAAVGTGNQPQHGIYSLGIQWLTTDYSENSSSFLVQGSALCCAVAIVSTHPPMSPSTAAALQNPPMHDSRLRRILLTQNSVVQTATFNWMFSYLPEICTKAQPQGFTCAGAKTFYNASVIWGKLAKLLRCILATTAANQENRCNWSREDVRKWLYVL